MELQEKILDVVRGPHVAAVATGADGGPAVRNMVLAGFDDMTFVGATGRPSDGFGSGAFVGVAGTGVGLAAKTPLGTTASPRVIPFTTASKSGSSLTKNSSRPTNRAVYPSWPLRKQ